MSKSLLFNPADLGLEDTDLVKEAVAVAVVRAASGKVAGRIRMQKLVFLLDKLGLESKFEYTYHHYGPYSSDLADALDFAKAFGLLSEIIETRKSDGANYSIYSQKLEMKIYPKSDFLNDYKIKLAIEEINKSSSTVLELAATAYWLKHDEKVDDWKTEIIRRKGQKAAKGRLDTAVLLLEHIGLGLSSRAA